MQRKAPLASYPSVDDFEVRPGLKQGGVEDSSELGALQLVDAIFGREEGQDQR